MQVTCKSIKTTKDHFIKKGLIDSYYNILNLSKFREDNVKWTNFAKSTYNVDEGLIYLEENNGKKAVPNTKVFTKIDEVKRVNSKSKEITYQKNQTVSNDGIIASEKTIRDLSARMSDRIGIHIEFESDRSKNYKGKIENNIAYINLAYATLDTPIHEILAHPIIRAIKYSKNIGGTITLKGLDTSTKKQELSQLYQNLLKELETGRGKEVLDRIKRDYVYKDKQASSDIQNILNGGATNFDFGFSENGETKTYNGKTYIYRVDNNRGAWYEQVPYTLEEQQEEAIVELLGLMTAEKLDAIKDGKLISLLKRLLKEMKQFVRSLLNQKEVEVNKLPDNMTLGDLSDLLAYSNSKIILPGYEVEYTTPDNMKFKTYAEASKHISDLARSVEDVDLSNFKIENELPDRFILNEFDEHNATEIYYKENGQWYLETQGDTFVNKEKITEEKARKDYSKYAKYQVNLNSFIEKNKEYEQSKEIIEEWKKVNDIKYDPEEVYSRGQGFYSVVGAYSDFDVNLMLQNLLQHLEDNKKAGGEFTISAFTKPVDRQIGHLEGGGGKIKFKIFPKSEDIKWAANTDVYSGSVWDASEKVNKDKKSEIIGVSYTKAPSLKNINAVQPNLASIIDELNHHHNELGITLTGDNFRLEYDDNVPYQTKALINSINNILDDRYGKIVEPEIEEKNKKTVYKIYKTNQEFNSLKEAEEAVKNIQKSVGNFIKISSSDIVKVFKSGKQPTQTRENTTSIESVKSKLGINTPNNFRHEDFSIGDVVTIEGIEGEYKIYEYEDSEGEIGVGTTEVFYNLEPVDESTLFDPETNPEGIGRPYFRVPTSKMKKVSNVKEKEKEYTSQALINTKIAALKEIAKKYPRSLIRSEVKPIQQAKQPLAYFEDELPFQKISKEKQIEMLYLKSLEISEEEIEERIKQCE